MSLRNLTADERKLMEEAKDKEVDQWISNAVFKIVRRTGVPITRIMAMRWILTWKEAPEGTKAKARLVAKGFTDPDLLTIRAEAPTLSKLGRHCLLQLACSHKFKHEVETSLLPFDKEIKMIRVAMFTWNQPLTYEPDSVLTKTASLS